MSDQPTTLYRHYNQDEAPEGWIIMTRSLSPDDSITYVVPVEPTDRQELCIYHHRPKKRKGMAHCEAVWTENASYPNGDCVVAQFDLVRVGNDE